MRKSIFYFCLLAVFAACKSKTANTEIGATPDSIFIAQDKTAVEEQLDTALIAEEMKMYKEKINSRITEYDKEIGRLTKEQEIEKDKLKKDQYGETIKSREERKRQLQERLEKIGNNMNEDWEAFKKDVQIFFEDEPSGK